MTKFKHNVGKRRKITILHSKIPRLQDILYKGKRFEMRKEMISYI